MELGDYGLDNFPPTKRSRLGKDTEVDVVDDTENASRNISNIGKNVPDTMCGLGDIRNNF